MNISDSGTGGPLPPVAPAPAPILYSSRVMLVLPWQKQVSPVTSYCVSQLMDRRRTSSILNYGDAFVAHTRNTCADLFLQSPCEWMLTIDDDMVVPFGDARWFNAYTRFGLPEPFASLNAIDRLMSHGKTLVGALYFGRHPGAPPMYCEGATFPAEAEVARKSPQSRVAPTKWVGTGCMLVHRSVFEAIEKKFPRLARDGSGRGGQWFTSTEATLLQRITALRDRMQAGPLSAEKAYQAVAGLEEALTSAKNENPLGSGEDVSFCMRAAAAGHQPHVDFGLLCGHIGQCVYGPQNTGKAK